MNPALRDRRLPFIAILAAILVSCSHPRDKFAGWPVYNGGKENLKYSSLTQIDTQTVSRLGVAWVYHTGDADTASHSQIQCNPIIIDSILYGVSAQMKLFAIHAGTGRPLWVFDPNAKEEFGGSGASFHIMINSRGVAYWTDGAGDRRIFFTAGSYTYAINALTGKPIREFGKNGFIDLHDGLGRDVKDLFVVNTSPGMVYRDLLIMGSRVDEAPPSAPGHIRAYDVRTGEMKWIFHTIPQPGETGYDTWADTGSYRHIGGANSWSGFTLDEKNGILFAPTGSAAYDFYGGKRKGSNLFANSLVALDAATGQRIWHYQIVHHDLWDKDLPAPPVLVTVNHNGKSIEAVAQTTKNGMLYVFDRRTGKPVFDIREIPVDTVSDLAGEKVWPTQPIPQLPPPFVRQTLTASDINPYLPDSQQRQLKRFLDSTRFGNMYLPPGQKRSLVFPGYDGGAEWGGPAYDPETGILYVNANEMAWVMEMKPVTPTKPGKENWGQAGRRLFMQHCSSCHGVDRKGTGNNPDLTKIQAKYQPNDIISLLNSGRRMMPSFQRLSEEEKKAIGSFILQQRQEQQHPFVPPVRKVDSADLMPYKITGYLKFLSTGGMPAISPPWGTLTAIDLNQGSILWKEPLGEYEEYQKRGIPPTGTENYGGPVVTAGGVLFIAAARDGKLRAFNKRTGQLLWQYDLPAPGFATPAVYEWQGRQYLVIACGGGKLGTLAGDAYMAFALPDDSGK